MLPPQKKKEKEKKEDSWARNRQRSCTNHSEILITQVVQLYIITCNYENIIVIINMKTLMINKRQLLLVLYMHEFTSCDKQIFSVFLNYWCITQGLFWLSLNDNGGKIFNFIWNCNLELRMWILPRVIIKGKNKDTKNIMIAHTYKAQLHETLSLCSL